MNGNDNGSSEKAAVRTIIKVVVVGAVVIFVFNTVGILVVAWLAS